MNKIAKKVINRRAILISFSLGIILLLLFSGFLYTEYNREKEMKINSVTHDYIRFQSQIENFIDSNINLMSGFSAYIKTFEEYNNRDIYTYLDNLTEKNAGFIRNIGIIQDTTIKWNYPANENAKALNVDLSKIPDQANSIAYVKTNLKFHFDGPKQLVQGGTGYIIRMPLLKDNDYWGMVSVVLDADKVQELFVEYAEECNLQVAIVNHSSVDKLIFGDPLILENEYLKFDSTFSGNQWTIYVVPTDPRIGNLNYLLMLALFGIFIISLIVRFIYHLLCDADNVKERNDILNSVVFRDRLTGIYNRSFLDIRIQEEIDHSNRHGTPLSIIYFDLDHFKRVNDTCGHSHGDNVLREITLIVGAYVRSNDILARWGGEEFAILMPSTTLLGAVTAAEKIRAVIEAIDFPCVGKVTASFGVAEYFVDEYVGSWFKRVDSALYQSKKGGRNRVTACETLAADVSAQYRIKWLKEWNSGNSIIDTDHKDLFHLGNLLVEDSYTLNTLEESISRYNELLSHIVAHFEREENILEDENYEGLNGHRISHQDLLEKAYALCEKFRENKIEAQDLFNFLMREVVIGHLAKEDTLFFHLFSIHKLQ